MLKSICLTPVTVFKKGSKKYELRVQFAELAHNFENHTGRHDKMESNHTLSDIPALLYTSHHNILPINHEVKTVWPRNHCKAMYEVEILTDKHEMEDIELERDIDEILNSNQYTCHICNLNVPKSYAKEHNSSKKHKICNDIANIALERTRKQMQLEIFAHRKIEVTDTYFCEPCSVVTLKSDKATHEATEIHAISVKHDELLEELLKIYKDFENVNVESETDELKLLKEKIGEKKLADIESTIADVDEVKYIRKGEKNLEVEEFIEDDKRNRELGKNIKVAEDILEGLRNDEIKQILDDIITMVLMLLLLYFIIDIRIKSNVKEEQDFEEHTKRTLEYGVEHLKETKLLLLEGKKYFDINEKQNIMLNEKIQEYEKITLECKVNLAELQSRLDKESTNNSKNAQMSQTKARMLKKLQMAKMKKQINNSPTLIEAEARILDEKSQVEDVTKTKDQSSKDNNNKDKTEHHSQSKNNESLFHFRIKALNENIENLSKNQNNTMSELVTDIEKRDAGKEVDSENKLTGADDKNKNIQENTEKVSSVKDKINVVNISTASAQTSEKVNQIASIMAKYFHKNCTVDALTNSSVEKNKHEPEHKGSNSNNRPKKVQFKDTKALNIDSDSSLISKEETEVNCSVDQNSNVETVINKNIQEYNKNQAAVNEKQDNKKNVDTNNKSVENSKPKLTVAKQLKKTFLAEVVPEKSKTKEKDDQMKNLDENKTNKVTEKQKNSEQEPSTSKSQNTTENMDKKTPPEKEINKSKSPMFSLVYYLKDLSRRCETTPIHTVEAATDNIVQITAINGDKFKILLNNFHSFLKKNGDIYCTVCWCPNIRRPEWHIAESDHREKIMTPIADLNGIRQLDDIWSHCTLCNDLINNEEFHINSLHHKNKVKQTLVSLGEGSPNVKGVKNMKCWSQDATLNNLVSSNHLALTNKNYLNCTICDVIVNYELSCVRHHVNSFDHLNNFEVKLGQNYIFNTEAARFYCIPCDIHVAKAVLINHINGKKHGDFLDEYREKIGQKKTEEENPEEIVALLSISQNVRKLAKDKANTFDSELICFVCNITIFTVEDHMETFDHKKNYLKYLERNKINEIEPDTFLCMPCTVVVGIDYLMSHCVSPKHKRKLDTFKGNIGHHLEAKNPINVSGKIEQSHVNMSKQTMSANMSDLTMSNPGMVITAVPNSTVSNLGLSNPTTSKVVTNLPSNTTKPIPTLTYPSVSNPNMSNPTMPIKIIYQFKELKVTPNLLCIICNEEVCYTKKHTAYHISTLDHVVAFNLMMLWNKIKKRDDKYFCDICRVDITYFSEIEHVLSKEHTDNLSKQPKGTVYEYDRTLLTHSHAISHKIGDRHRPSPILSKIDK